MITAPQTSVHDSPTILLATLFAARRSGDSALQRLMLRRLTALGIKVRFAGRLRRKAVADG